MGSPSSSTTSKASLLIGKGRSGSTAPTISTALTTNSWPPSERSSTLTVPCNITLDSMRASLRARKASSPIVSFFPTHWISPVESRRTMNRILLEPRVRLIHPFNSTVFPSYKPSCTSPIQTVLAILAPVCPFVGSNSMSPPSTHTKRAPHRLKSGKVSKRNRAKKACE